MALRLFQDWAIAFKSKAELSFFVDVYNELKNSGEPAQACRCSSIARRHISPSPFIDVLASSHHDYRSRLGRLGCLHALQDRFHIHQPETPLQKLRFGL